MKENTKISFLYALTTLFIVLCIVVLKNATESKQSIKNDHYKALRIIDSLQTELKIKEYLYSMQEMKTAKSNLWILEKERKFQTKSNKQIKESPLRALK